MTHSDETTALAAKDQFTFNDLIRIMEKLRAPDGCPWDREQTHVSLKRYLIEESYEVLEAIDLQNDAMLCEELGDVLLQIVFHANVSESFSIDDVITGICKKMITRHPHVFGNTTVANADEVLVNWEQIKQQEKGIKDHATILKKVPPNLPALMRAYKVQQKAADAKFDWDQIEPVFDKIQEELSEVREAMADKNPEAITDETGDLLFAMVNLSRFLKVHPELALTTATEKFIRRFEKMETMIQLEQKVLEDMSLAQMDLYWEKAKTALRNCPEPEPHH